MSEAKQKKFGIAYGLSGVRGEIAVVKPDGRLEQRQKFKNIILDTGMDLVATTRLSELTAYLAWGDGTDPTQRDSSTTTASQSGTTVTASANFFEAADVGRLIKFDTGETAYIATYTSQTEVEVDVSQTVASGEFTVWYVDDVNLANQLGRADNYRTNSGDNQTTLSGGVVDYKRTHLTSAFGSAETIRELGWSPNSGTADLFNRVLLGSPVSVQAGDQLLVISHLEVTQSPQSSAASSPSPSGDWTTELDGFLQFEGSGLSAINSSGGGGSSLDASNISAEPSGTEKLTFWTANDSFVSYGTPKDASGGTNTQLNVTNVAYSNGDFYRDKTGTLTTSQHNTTIGSIGFSNGNSSPDYSLRHRVTTPPTKANTNTLKVTFRISWSRTLDN